MDLIEQLRNYLEGVEWNGPADAFYEHAVQARSQYDEQYRAMATEILAARKAIRRAADALTGQEGAAPSPRADDALRYAIALMTNRLPVEAPTNAAIIRQHIADLDRLRAQPLTAPVAERGWQPIETAPAGCMLLFCSMRALEVPKWCWVDWLAGGSLNLHADWKATHWMPLPAPPASGERTER